MNYNSKTDNKREDTTKVFTKDTIVKILIDIRKIKSEIGKINETKSKLVTKKDILSTTLEKTKNAMYQIDNDYSEYKKLVAYTIDIDYYVKKYIILDTSNEDIHNKFKSPRRIKYHPNISMATIKSHPNIKFIISLQTVNTYKNTLDKIIRTNNAEVALYRNTLYKKSLVEYYNSLGKINADIETEKADRYEIYKQIINEIIDGNIVRNIPFYNTKLHTERKNILSQIECTKQQIKLNSLKKKELKKRIIEYTNVIENDIYNVQETLFNNILSEVSKYFSTETHMILIESLDKKYKTLVVKLEHINTQLTNLSAEFSKLFNRMVDILQRISISQIHIWNSAIKDLNLTPVTPLNLTPFTPSGSLRSPTVTRAAV
jgi:hypothetical protein